MLREIPGNPQMPVTGSMLCGAISGTSQSFRPRKFLHLFQLRSMMLNFGVYVVIQPEVPKNRWVDSLTSKRIKGQTAKQTEQTAVPRKTSSRKATKVR